jgi:hypothetical protein
LKLKSFIQKRVLNKLSFYVEGVSTTLTINIREKDFEDLTKAREEPLDKITGV